MNNSCKSILEAIEESPLSTSLGKALRLASRAGIKELDRWCRLELGGYYVSNPAMGEDIVVPEYRTVVGQHADIFGRVLVLPSDFAFVNETRLRNGVEELEALESSRDTVVTHDPHTCELIRKHIDVEVYSFRFSSVHLKGVLSAIRMELVARLQQINTSETKEDLTLAGQDEKILMMSPNFYGVGINLRALWKRFISSE